MTTKNAVDITIERIEQMVNTDITADDWRGYSIEFCGGTHLDNTGAVQEFEILSEEGVSAGTRRIVALTGTRAADHAKLTEDAIRQIASTLSVMSSETA